MTGDMLRAGRTFRVSPERHDGARVVAADSGLEFDMTDEAVAGSIRQHLQPCFHALLAGIPTSPCERRARIRMPRRPRAPTHRAAMSC